MGIIRETAEMSDTERMAARNSNSEYLNEETNKREPLSNKVDSFSEDVSEDDAKAQYPSIQCLKDMVHIVESGTSGIWNYRKWSDGTAECWGKWSETGIAITTASRGAYFSDSMTKTLPFIFKGSDTINVGHVSGGMWLGNTWVSSNSNTLNYSISRATSATSESCDIRIFIIGKWK